MKKQRNLLLGLLAVFLLSSAPAMATPLGLTMDDEPDIAVAFITTAYNAAAAPGATSFTANGFALDMDHLGNNTIIGGSFDLTAIIDGAGVLGGGSFTIGGTIAGLGFNSGTLLTGNLTALGFDPAGGGVLEWLFDVTGGDAAALYDGTGGIIMADTGFAGAWGADFGNFMASADVGIVPEPGILLLEALGLTLLVLARRRRKV
ncbi:MAG: PEP-CTERM sorting domain-containing protein [Gammaproteobacteria bacterium]|nr:PEP-CTERM sorting domain-containing protein [Gammaproteobacteria bacterium]